MKTKSVFIYKMISIGFCILLSLTMFSNIENRLIESLDITSKNGLILTIIGLVSFVVIYFVQMTIGENGTSCYGSFFFFSSIVINLMDTHIVSTIFYWVIRLTLGNVVNYIRYAMHIWEVDWALKIGVGIFLILFLLVAYVGIVFLLTLPKYPVIGIFVFIIYFLLVGICLVIVDPSSDEAAKSHERTKSNSGGRDIIFDAYKALEEERTRADIKRAADELENIRWKLSKK